MFCTSNVWPTEMLTIGCTALSILIVTWIVFTTSVLSPLPGM
jgi:hypothetical protein